MLTFFFVLTKIRYTFLLRPCRQLFAYQDCVCCGYEANIFRWILQFLFPLSFTALRNWGTNFMEKKSRCSLVVTVTRLPAERPWFDSLHGMDLSPSTNVQSFSDSNLTTCLKRAECFLPGVKRPGHEVEHSSPTSAEIKNAWVYTSTPLHVFLGCTWNMLPLLYSLLFHENTQLEIFVDVSIVYIFVFSRNQSNNGLNVN